ncbi:MAG TPA: hypothetical protein VMS17_21860 [Gemmataceae bacterium]|nr:hypothetical protein [Gemmataceae bacterium]
MIYAVGPDGKDDGGVFDPKDMDRPGADVGFRLWNASRRGQAP